MNPIKCNGCERTATFSSVPVSTLAAMVGGGDVVSVDQWSCGACGTDTLAPVMCDITAEDIR